MWNLRGKSGICVPILKNFSPIYTCVKSYPFSIFLIETTVNTVVRYYKTNLNILTNKKSIFKPVMDSKDPIMHNHYWT